MSVNAKIKVIKKHQLNKTQEDKAVDLKSKRESARQMVSNVSTWVSEFKDRRRENAKQAFENLFSQPSEINGV